MELCVVCEYACLDMNGLVHNHIDVLYISLLVFLIHKVTIVELMSSGRRVSDYYPNTL